MGSSPELPGKRLKYVQDPNLAAGVFNTGDVLARAPKQKHTFFVVLSPSREALMWSKLYNYNLMESIFNVSSSDVPNVSYDTEVMDEYNRKRIVQKRVNFDPVNITFYDDNSSEIQRLFKTYSIYYYGDSRDENYDTWNSKGPDGHQTHNFGFRYKSVPFFERMSIFKLHADHKVTSWTCFNPIITYIRNDSVSYDNIEYSTINISFEHEGFVQPNISTPLEHVTGKDAGILKENILGSSGAVNHYVDYYTPSENTVNPRKGNGFITGLSRFHQDVQSNNGDIKKTVIDDIKRDGAGSLSKGLSSWGNFKFG